MVALGDLDPSNLLALHALLEERHVTRAARRLGLTQSSMSHRLRRLRESLRDPLFVRVGATLVPTARAEAIARPLAEALDALRAAVAEPARFDPKTARFTLSIALPDLLAPLVSGLLAELTVEAPGVDLRVCPITAELSRGLSHGDPAMALAPSSFASGDAVSRAAGALRFGVVTRRGHPSAGRKLTVERWLSYGHVVVRIENERRNVVADELARRGLARRVALEVPSFVSGLLVVGGSDLMMNAPMPLAREVCDALGLVVRPAPIEIAPVRFALLWHERFQGDAAHQWARARVLAAARARFGPR